MVRNEILDIVNMTSFLGLPLRTKLVQTFGPVIKDEPRSGRRVTNKVDANLEIVEQDQHISSYDIAKELGIEHKTVFIHLQNDGYTKSRIFARPRELPAPRRPPAPRRSFGGAIADNFVTLSNITLFHVDCAHRPPGDSHADVLVFCF
ncbi:hypothetical protein EVAR_8175_1 [Eumeta japonica]|uniref:Histone-lysine N-methyltransferase SETMAR n=1 Tax=Eumeta variegata TaxID=151549 RepID=A0A4C1TGA2_EUMVA|nr:hypothetical protein EVAR_8175_1 [Eumeta japonica]